MWNPLPRLKRILSPKIHLAVQLDLTNGCNLRCSHCYHSHHSNEGGLTPEQWLVVVERVRELCEKWGASPRFMLCGGEPTLSPAFPLISMRLRELWDDARICVLTNGTSLDRPLPGGASAIELIRGLRMDAQISLDGSNEGSHDRIRGSNSFRKALHGASLIRNSGRSLTLQTVLSAQIVDEIPQFFELAQGLGANAMNFVRLVEQGYGKRFVSENPGTHLIGSALKAAMEKILAESRRTGVPTYTGGPLWTLVDPALGSANRLGFYDIIIDYQGQLKVSSRTPVRLGNVTAEGELERLLLQSPVLKRLRSGTIEGCSGCEYFELRKCSGDRNVAFAATGDFNGPDMGCWKWRAENETKASWNRVSSTGRSAERKRLLGRGKSKRRHDVGATV